MTFEQIFYGVVIGLWFAGVIIYILHFRKQFIQRQKEKEETKHKRKLGKRCPQCRNIINYQRLVCQHCGYQFPEVPSHPHYPAKRKKRGKKCPGCGNVINYYREVCQHCGYKFKIEQKAEPAEAKSESSSEPGSKQTS